MIHTLNLPFIIAVNTGLLNLTRFVYPMTFSKSQPYLTMIYIWSWYVKRCCLNRYLSSNYSAHIRQMYLSFSLNIILFESLGLHLGLCLLNFFIDSNVLSQFVQIYDDPFILYSDPSLSDSSISDYDFYITLEVFLFVSIFIKSPFNNFKSA